MPIKYIMPDWDDYLDAEFDFHNDTFSTEENGTRHLRYIHEIMGENTPYDGILVSLNQIEKRKGALKGYDNRGADRTIREIMRIPQNIEIIGDCGAFSYKDKPKPAIEPEVAARLYHEYAFDMGASVDHMIVDEIEVVNENGEKEKHTLNEEEKARRVRLTVKNARLFLAAIKSNHYQFTPVGSIQARNAEEYAEVFSKYIEMGYREIALGSLVPKTDTQIEEIILAVGARYRALKEDIRQQVHIHLFGVLRPALFGIYERNGISSFDSASYFRKAWLRSDKNYLANDGQWYSAIRVPQTTLPKNRNQLIKAGVNIHEIEALERDVLRRLDGFNAGTDIEELLNILVRYDGYFERISDGGESLRESYRRILTDRPWEHCDCEICQQLGIQVMIFRGYNRNKRRGFHNTYVFYHNYNGGAEFEQH